MYQPKRKKKERRKERRREVNLHYYWRQGTMWTDENMNTQKSCFNVKIPDNLLISSGVLSTLHPAFHSLQINSIIKQRRCYSPFKEASDGDKNKQTRQLPFKLTKWCPRMNYENEMGRDFVRRPPSFFRGTFFSMESEGLKGDLKTIQPHKTEQHVILKWRTLLFFFFLLQ